MKKWLHSGNMILAGFSGMVLFMCYLVYQCNIHPSVMVSNNYYEQEIKYQDVIDAEKNANALADPIRMERGTQDLVFHLPEEVNHDLKRAEVVLYNQADDSKDQKVGFDRMENGIYSIPISEQMKGHYNIKISLSTSSKTYYKEFPVIL